MRLTKSMIALGAACALATGSAALADALVVRSTGPSAVTYPVGRRLPPATRVVLRAGDRVVLVGEGATRTLSGPGNFPVRATISPNQNRRATLGRYLSASGASISRTGAVRGPGEGPASAPNLWVVDIARGGTICTTDMANVTLWRAEMGEDTLLTVEDVAHPAQHAQLAFVSGQNFRRWPSETLPISEGASYRIAGPGLTRPTQISFVTLANPPQDAEGIANALADKGCTTQLAQLGDRLAEDSGGH